MNIIARAKKALELPPAEMDFGHEHQLICKGEEQEYDRTRKLVEALLEIVALAEIEHEKDMLGRGIDPNIEDAFIRIKAALDEMEKT